MKAVVMEIKGTKVVALSEDGTFTDIRNNGYSIGQSIKLEGNRMKRMSRKYRSIAVGIAASMVILLGGGSAYAYNTPVAHVSLDVNPSIMYSVNAFDKVIAIDASNEDAKPIIDTIDWKGEELSVVVNKTIEAMKDFDYANGKEWYENEVLIGVNADSEKTEQKLVKMIKSELQEIVLNESGIEITEDDLEGSVVGIGNERVAEASALTESLGFVVTPGKLNLVEKLNASLENSGEDTLNSSESAVLLKGSVKEIMAQLHRNEGIGNPDGVTKGGIDDETAIDNNGNGMVNANENANKNTNKNASENQIEKPKNVNAEQNRASDGAIKSKND